MKVKKYRNKGISVFLIMEDVLGDKADKDNLWIMQCPFKEEGLCQTACPALNVFDDNGCKHLCCARLPAIDRDYLAILMDD
jgi:hypothetical protein